MKTLLIEVGESLDELCTSGGALDMWNADLSP
jgi:hypothetical protein